MTVYNMLWEKRTGGILSCTQAPQELPVVQILDFMSDSDELLKVRHG